MVGDVIIARFRMTHTYSLRGDREIHMGEEWVSHFLQGSLDRRCAQGLLGDAGIWDELSVLSALPDS